MASTKGAMGEEELGTGLGVHFGAGSPIQALQERQNNCGNTAAIFDKDCWTSEEVAFFLSDPKTGWAYTYPKCNDTQADGVGCCTADETWSTCFVRFGRNLAGADCNVVNPQHCTWDNELRPDLDPAIFAKVRYVLKNIYTMNDFFTTYYEALQNAGSSAANIAAPLTSTVDGISPSVNIINVLTGLTAGLSFLGAPELAGVILGLQAVTRLAAQAMSIGLQQAPGVARAMWPVGTTDSQIFQISALESQLSTAVDQMENMLNAGLGLMMSDIPTFVNFASSGSFSGHESLSLPNVTDGLDFALKTYMTSESLSQNDWFAVIYGYFNASSFENANCANIAGGVLCSETGDKSHYDQSGGTFWSSSSGRMYMLQHHKGDSYSYPIMSAINSNGWADMVTLFDGAYNCVADGKAGGPILNFYANSTLDQSCISQLPIYWMNTPTTPGCPASAADGSCLFGQWNA
ncbi:hypothetical protein ACLMJK_009471 [Lecanora helva]